eukprot:1091334-Ditylum_brightwellii.AAC.1
MNQVTSLMATQNMLSADMVQLHARVEQIERAGSNPGPTEPPERSKGADQPKSPPAESHKKRQKNSDP